MIRYDFWLMEEPNLFDQTYELGEIISSGPHSELRRCRKIGNFFLKLSFLIIFKLKRMVVYRLSKLLMSVHSLLHLVYRLMTSKEKPQYAIF